MTQKLPPKQTLDERVQRATAAFLVAVARDPAEHPDVRQDARQRLKRPPVETLAPYVATLTTDQLRALRAVLRGEEIPCSCGRSAPPTTEPGPEPANEQPEPGPEPATEVAAKRHVMPTVPTSRYPEW